MDEQGIHAALMFPGRVLALEVEFQDDVDAIYANAQAFNRWIYDQIGYAHQSRMFLPPYIPLADVDLAVRELERVIERGRAAGGDHHGPRARRPRQPARRALGRRSGLRSVLGAHQRGGVRVATHLGPTDYAKYGADWSEDPDAVLRDFDALQWVLYWGDRPAMETVAGMILHGLFGRFPNVRVCLAGAGHGLAAVPAAQAGPRLPDGPRRRAGASSSAARARSSASTSSWRRSPRRT